MPVSRRWPRSSTPRPARACSTSTSKLCGGRSASSSIRKSCNRPRAADNPMTTLPDYEAFARAYGAGEAEVAVTTLVADLETPVSAYLKLARGRAGNMFLLESVEGGAQRGRYSMIGLDPDLIFRSSGDHAEINRPSGLFRPLPGRPARRPEGAPRRIPHRDAAGPAADVGGRVRLSRLRHGK